MNEDRQVQIDFMTPADVPAVLEIERASFEDPWPDEVFKAELRHCWSHCRVLRGGDDAGVIGYVVFWSVADEVHLLNIAVDPAERKHHLGRLLLDSMLEFAREHKARFVTLEVRRTNQAAIHLYESAGFKRVGVRPRYYASDGEDAIVMLYDLGSLSGMSPLPGSGAGATEA